MNNFDSRNKGTILKVQSKTMLFVVREIWHPMQGQEKGLYLI